MMDLEYKMGQVEARLDSLDSQVASVKEDTRKIASSLNKGKGIFIGLMLAAGGVGAFFSELFKKFMHN